MKTFFIFLLTLIVAPALSLASTIRDAEIERIIRQISTPIFESAGLDPYNVDIYLINNPEINAFVSQGQNIFIHTGLISLSEDPELLTGVLAHETGHIAGGHLLSGRDSAKAASIQAAIGYAIGIAAAAIAPEAGMAIATGSEHIALRNLLKHTRTNEEAADQAGLSYLEDVGWSPRGLLKVLETIYTRQRTLYGEVNPYTITHPLSQDRMNFIKNYIEQSPQKSMSMPKSIQTAFARAVVKLRAFLAPYRETLRLYPEEDSSFLARYARAIAYYKIPNLEKSLAEIDVLIKQYPKDPYVQELKGQILYENGRIKQAIKYYKKAHELLPNSPLIQLGYATTLIATEETKRYSTAISLLRKTVTTEKRNAYAWRQLAIAYGRTNQLDKSNAALAEEAIILGRYDNALNFIQTAQNYVKTGSPTDLRLHDLRKLAHKLRKQKAKSK
jgi:predicted Zn-dependent protease